MERLGRYEIVAELGQGAMGTVYKAIDPRLDRTVALKTVRLDASSLADAEFRVRFQQEARSAGRLSHPNIVTVYDFGEVDEVAYIAMEFLRGETLREMLDRQRFPPARAVRYAIQIADGLASAHASGVVHRDIKPANIVRLHNGLIKITDFGIAQTANADLTQEGTLLGTPKYMSPEQLRGLRVDGRSDIFSLGVMLYEMLTGVLPFGGSSLAGLMYQIVHEPPVHPARWMPHLPDALVAILARCLAKDADARYQNASELALDLRQYRNPNFVIAPGPEVFLPLTPPSQIASPDGRFELPDFGAPAPEASRLMRTTVVLENTVQMPALKTGMAPWMTRLRSGFTSAFTSGFGSGLVPDFASGSRPGSGKRGLRVTALAALAVCVLVFGAAVVAALGDRQSAADASGAAHAATTHVETMPRAAAVSADIVQPIPIGPVGDPIVTSPSGPSTVPEKSAAVKPAARHARPRNAPVETVQPAAIPDVAQRQTAALPEPQPVAVPVPAAAPEPKGFAGFLQRQRECITQNKCDPPTSPTEIRN